MEDFKRTDFGYSVAWYVVATVVESVLVSTVLFQNEMPIAGFIVTVYIFLLILIVSSVTWLTKSSMAIIKLYNPNAVRYVIVIWLVIKIVLELFFVVQLKGLV